LKVEWIKDAGILMKALTTSIAQVLILEAELIRDDRGVF
jgi:hypothetical protein